MSSFNSETPRILCIISVDIFEMKTGYRYRGSGHKDQEVKRQNGKSIWRQARRTIINLRWVADINEFMSGFSAVPILIGYGICTTITVDLVFRYFPPHP